ncbi:response regulator transcription factor [Paracidovorax cattleyae]|uniref:response regulator transcription factor n=1 Tax=Paracidovorax cattleyae TaxID=80868 RepID=UPI003EC113B5
MLGLLAEGRSNKDIAEQMGTSVRTVETHRLHLRRKLRIDGRPPRRSTRWPMQTCAADTHLPT